jgi:LCP family protein required for cell wall assembly
MNGSRRALVSVCFALLVAACSSNATPVPSGGPGRTSPAGGPTLAPGAVATQGVATGLDQLTGTDGRFTLLVLGSDARGKLSGERTDTIMVVTVDPTTGKVSMVSLPRDMEKVPIAPNLTYGAKVTGLFQYYKLVKGDNRAKQFGDMVKAMEFTFGIEIDRYALAHFTSVTNLIDHIGGIDVTLARKFVDTSKPTSHIVPGGLILKKGVNHLDGIHALGFMRSRETTSDYDRARRQQQVISVTIQKVLGMGADGLPALAQAVLSDSGIETNLQLADASALYGLAQHANLSAFKSFVLQPGKYGSGGGPPNYATFLNVPAVRALFKKLMTSN